MVMLLSLDSQKRVALGKLLKGRSVTLLNGEIIDGKIVLEPMHAIPERELWLYENPAALKSVRQGLKEAAEGKISAIDV